jgi:hypothetical protein
MKGQPLMTITANPPDADITARAGYAAGLRRLADILDEHDEIPLPVHGHLGPLTIQFTGEHAAAKMAVTSTIIPCEWATLFRQGSHGVMVALAGHLLGLRIHLIRYLGDGDVNGSAAAYAAGRIDVIREAARETRAKIMTGDAA